MQHASDFCKLGASGLECPAIFFKTILTSLMVLNSREDSLAQAIVLCNNLASHLHIIYYFAGIDFAQNLMSWQEVIVTVLAETAFIEHLPKLLINFIYGVQKRDVFICSICDQLTQGQVSANNKDYTFDNQRLLKQNNKV